MNKELIKTYKTEFDHWLNGGKVLSKYTLLPEWSDCQDENIWRIPSKNITQVLIVINDEYVEFRKAMAEGKIIEYLNYKDEWENLVENCRKLEGVPVKDLRIKPEEPKFKVGDWVRVKTDTFEYDGTARISKGVKRLSKSDMWLFNENHYKCNPDNYIEHWQPKPDEWCWFWNFTDMPILAKLISIEYFLERPTEYKIKTPSYISKTVYSCMTHMYFKNCEPFIGQLPSNLKEYK